MRKPTARIDLIAVKPLWGVYASNVRWNSQFTSDVYFLDYDAKSAAYGNQSAREQRRTFGARYFNRLPGEPARAGFDYNLRLGVQAARSLSRNRMPLEP